MSNVLSIKSYAFKKEAIEECSRDEKGRDWPVVYLINNDKELYIGETSNLCNRFKQHLENVERKRLSALNVIYDDEFNKSAILDIEQTLIQLCGADNKFRLQNLNSGQSARHNYYQREKYINKIDTIWKKLSQIGLTKNPLDVIRNSDLFKFSPYTSLTEEQNEVCNEALENIINCLEKGINGTTIINGTVGTGKTVVMINIIFRLITAINYNFNPDEEDSEALSDNIRIMNDIKRYINSSGNNLKIAFVVPMSSIRKTIKKVFQASKSSIKAGIIKGPLDISKEQYDIVFVDESHRLPRCKNYQNVDAYRQACDRLNLDYKKDSTLDMIIKNSRYRVLVYDEDQRVRETDITKEMFSSALANTKIQHLYLDTQMRCKGGRTYISYLSRILNCYDSLQKQDVENYDFLFFDNAGDMVRSIKNKDKEYGLCRVVAGYGWEWISKNCKTYEEVLEKGLQDIEINGEKYVWNMTNQEFILSKNAINEVGCIHTTQGYDLNYVGVIFGPEIDYDPLNNKIRIDVKKFYDMNAKKGASYESIKDNIINAYKTLMARGIRGCYVSAYNPNLKAYLKRFITSE